MKFAHEVRGDHVHHRDGDDPLLQGDGHTGRRRDDEAPDEERVAQLEFETAPAFRNEFWDSHEAGRRGVAAATLHN